MTTTLEHQDNFINEEIIKLKLENKQLKDKNIELESRLKNIQVIKDIKNIMKNIN